MQESNVYGQGAAKPTGNAERGMHLITLAEAGEYINCSYSTILRLAKSGELPACRIGSSWRTSFEACDWFVERRFAAQRLICRSVEV